MRRDILLLDVLRDPSSVSRLTPTQWDLLIRQARRAELLSRVEYVIRRAGCIDDVPEEPRVHLESARLIAVRHARAVRWEVQQIEKAMAHIDLPLTLLKGAAYVMSDAPAAPGRVFNDVDIIVPESRIEEAEQAMFRHGWGMLGLTEYDASYYRQWMHELPPMTHVKRRTVVDMHHRILPRTARSHPDSDKLFSAAVRVESPGHVQVFGPLDMVLHSACHLFYEGEFDHGLRDLVDLDALLRGYAETETDFWDALLARAAILELSRPLSYALRYTHQLLGTPIPEQILRNSRQGSDLSSWWMDRLFKRALMPDHASCDDGLTGIARWLLFVRGHYLRMPLHLLIPHLARKAFVVDMKT